MKENKKPQKDKKGIKNFLSDVAENIKEGAAFVGNKTKETAADAYVSGSEFVGSTNKKIHKFTEKQHIEKEHRTIEKRQKELQFAFGKLTLGHYLKNGSLHKAFLITKDINIIVLEFRENLSKLNKIEKEINKF